MADKINEDNILIQDISELPKLIQNEAPERQRCIRAALATVFSDELERFIRETIRDIRNLDNSIDRMPTQEEILIPDSALRDFVETGTDKLEIVEECLRLMKEKKFSQKIGYLEELLIEYARRLKGMKEIAELKIKHEHEFFREQGFEELQKIAKAIKDIDSAFPEIGGIEDDLETEIVMENMGKSLRAEKKYIQ